MLVCLAPSLNPCPIPRMLPSNWEGVWETIWCRALGQGRRWARTSPISATIAWSTTNTVGWWAPWSNVGATSENDTISCEVKMQQQSTVASVASVLVKLPWQWTYLRNCPGNEASYVGLGLRRVWVRNRAHDFVEWLKEKGSVEITSSLEDMGYT